MQIETGIPVPPKRGGNHKYDWEKMIVGASFFKPGATINTMSGNANRAASRFKMKFRCSTVEENGQVGVRVWRIA